MEIRKLKREEFDKTLELIWNVFNKTEAFNYKESSKLNIYSLIHSKEYLDNLNMYGAIINNKIVGVIATRNHNKHLALFYVETSLHKKGIGRELFNTLIEENNITKLTVHSSIYAFDVYKHLGFNEVGPLQVEDGIKFIPMIYEK